MPPFQYSLRDLFLMTTLIAVGVAGIVWFIRSFGHGIDDLPRIAVAIASAGSIGAGIGAPFHKKLLGLAIGGVALVILGFLFPHVSD